MARTTPSERLFAAIEAMRLAMRMGEIEIPGGTAKLGVIVKGENGGRVVAEFDAEPFFEDIGAIISEALGEAPLDEAAALKHLESMQAFLDAGDDASCADAALELIEDLVFKGRFHEIDILLSVADLTQFGLQIHVGLLVSTCQKKDKIPGRATYFERVRDWVLEHEPAEAEKLLQGLE